MEPMASNYHYYHERCSSAAATAAGNPPLLYDTSTSTADADSYSSSSRQQHHQQQQHNNMRPNNTTSNQRHHVATYPRVRKTMSDSGVGDYQYDTIGSYRPTRGSAASDVGVLSASDQIRKYNNKNRRHRHHADPALKLVDEYNDQEPQEFSYTGKSPLRPMSMGYKPKLGHGEFLQIGPSGQRENTTPETKRSSQQEQQYYYYGDSSAGRFKSTQALQHHTSRQGPVSVDLATNTTGFQKQKQLWNSNGEMLQASRGKAASKRLDQKLERHRSLSPSAAASAHSNNTIGSGSTSQSFQSKYVTAARVARDSVGSPPLNSNPPPPPVSTTTIRRRNVELGRFENAEKEFVGSIRHSIPTEPAGNKLNLRIGSPVATTSTTNTTTNSSSTREETRSRATLGGGSGSGRETLVKSPFLSPHDERGTSTTDRYLDRSTFRNKAGPPSLHIPPLNSVLDEHKLLRGSAAHHYNRQSPSSQYGTQEAAPYKVRTQSIETRGRDQVNGDFRARSLSRDRLQNDPSNPHSTTTTGRPISPLIQQRLLAITQESRGRTLSQMNVRGGTSTRSNSHEPRSSRTTNLPVVHNSVEKLGGESTSHMPQTNSSSSSPSCVPSAFTQMHQRDTGSNNQSTLPHRSESAQPSQENLVRRMTTIRDQASHRSPYLGHRPPTPIDHSASINPANQASRQEHNNSKGSTGCRSQQHANVAVSWQEKAKSSPPLLTPEYHVALLNHSYDDSSQSLHKPKVDERIRSTDRGSSPSIQQHDVSDLVAKLSAVNRANPAEALAQIDSILRHESSTRSPTTTEADQIPRHGLVEIGQHESLNDFLDGETASDRCGDSDDETSVSSMTNPTYQESSSNKPYNDPALVRLQLARDLQGSFPPTNFPSTSSFRRPRPSGLESYNPSRNLQQDSVPGHRHDEGRTNMRKVEERQEQLTQYQSPLTINARDYHESSPPPQSPLPIESEDRFMVTVTENRNYQCGDERVKITVTQQGHTKKDDPPAQYKTTGTLPAPTRKYNNRTHPWDEEIPARAENIATRETSMEDAIGVEAAMPSRNTGISDNHLLRTPDISLMEEHSKPKASPNTMRAIRQKSLVDEFPDDSFMFSDPQPQDRRWSQTRSEFHEEIEHAPIVNDTWATIQEGGIFPDIPSIPDHATGPQNSKGDSWQLPPQLDTPQEMKESRRRGGLGSSDHSTKPFFPPHQDTIAPRRRGGPIDWEKSVEPRSPSIEGTMAPTPPTWLDDEEKVKGNLEHGRIKEAFDQDGAEFVETFRDMETCRDINTSRDISDNLGMPPSRNCIRRPDPSKTKRRGFLRAFVRKEKKKEEQHMPRQRAPIVPAPTGSYGGSSESPTYLHGPPQIRLQPLSPALYPEPIAEQGRGRSEIRHGNPTQRSRSASMEQFRSSNMARKFGKVLRLYDQD